MSGRGPQTFKKRQKEQQRKERQQEKAATKRQRKLDGPATDNPETDDLEWLGLLDRQPGPKLGDPDPQAPSGPVETGQ